MPTREESADPKPIAVAEVQAHKGTDHYEWQTWHVERLLATARAAAEVDSLRARLDAQTQHSIALARMIEALARGEHPPKSEHAPHLGLVAERAQARVDKLQTFKDYVHQRLDAAGVPADPEADKNAEHGCRIEGRLNFIEATADSLRAQLEEARKVNETLHWRIERTEAILANATSEATKKMIAQPPPPIVIHNYEAAKERDTAHAALTAARGEVAVLREALGAQDRCGGWNNHDWANSEHPGECVRCRITQEQCMAIEDALASTRATAEAHDERVRREAIAWWINNTTTDEALRALLHPDPRKLYCAQCSLNGTGMYEVGTCPGNTSVCIEAREARALAHPTKEKP